MTPMKDTKWYAEFSERAILMGFRGSQAHGTYRPNTDPTSIDDIDVMAILIQPKEAYLGFGRQETYERMEDPWDIVAYDVKHFVRLLCKQNPNVMSMLWMRRSDYQHISEAGQLLIDNRDLFISKDAYHSFTGYAYSQLHKMTHGANQGYMGAKRKQLVDKFGYDTKNASHLIRLLNMNIEFLSTGVLNVLREDNTYLVQIKRGEFPLDYIQAEARKLFDIAKAALANSKLPDHVDMGKAENLLVRILSEKLLMEDA